MARACEGANSSTLGPDCLRKRSEQGIYKNVSDTKKYMVIVQDRHFILCERLQMAGGIAEMYPVWGETLGRYLK